jgi:hypothetical protein
MARRSIASVALLDVAFLATFIGLPVLVVSLDVLTYFGGRIAPHTVANTICALRPFTVIAAPLIRTEWFDYVAAQCAGFAAEPALSMIAFMAKASLALIAFPLLFFALMFGLTIDKPIGEAHGAKKKPTFFEGVSAVGFWLTISVGGWLLEIYHMPDEFSVSLHHKFVEDCLVVNLIVSAFVVTAPIWSLGRKLVERIRGQEDHF